MTGYNTPTEWVHPIGYRIGGFDLDPCASETSDHADTNVRLEGGLSTDWTEYDTVWVNHPFGRGEPEKWLRAAVHADCETVVTLSKCDPSADWFQQYYTQADVWFFPGQRLAFGGRESPTKYPVIYGIFGEYNDSVIQWMDRNGMVVKLDSSPVQATLEL